MKIAMGGEAILSSPRRVPVSMPREGKAPRFDDNNDARFGYDP
jgi:hypothetical protein